MVRRTWSSKRKRSVWRVPGGCVVNDTDVREADLWTRRAPMTKQEKLEAIREMKAQLVSGEKRTLDAATL